MYPVSYNMHATILSILGPIVDIIENEIKNRDKTDKRGQGYSDSLKRLVLTLHYASSAAYRIMRFLDFNDCFVGLHVHKVLTLFRCVS